MNWKCSLCFFLMSRLHVSRFLSLLSEAECCIIISLAICSLGSSAFFFFFFFFFLHQRHSVSPCSALDFPAVVAQRGMAQLLISSVSSSFSQPKACRAGGGQGRRKRKLKCLLLFLLSAEGFIERGVIFFYFFTLAWRDGGLGLPSNTHSHSISLHPVCMCVCE